MHMRRTGKVFSVLILLGLFTDARAMDKAAPAADPSALPAYQVDLSQTSVSGLSSGAFMAGQFAVAYSAIVGGAGIVAGGPYFCSGYPGIYPFIPYLSNAMSVCMNPAQAQVAPPVASVLWQDAQAFARAGAIDDTANLKRQRIYLFSGTKDQTVTRAVVDQTGLFYQLAGVPAAQVRYVTDVDAGHAMITDKSGDLACPSTAPPYINDCHFVQASDILTHIYGNLNPPAAVLSGKILSFNQRSFLHSPYSSMSNTAYAYVPKSCATETCRVHVVFHGCEQGAAVIGNRFYAGTGYNPVADSNHIIVLYPQVEPSPVYPYNPKGCWDFWGYTDINPFLPDFYAKSGMQMQAVKAMLDRLAAPRSALH